MWWFTRTVYNRYDLDIDGLHVWIRRRFVERERHARSVRCRKAGTYPFFFSFVGHGFRRVLRNWVLSLPHWFVGGDTQSSLFHGSCPQKEGWGKMCTASCPAGCRYVLPAVLKLVAVFPQHARFFNTPHVHAVKKINTRTRPHTRLDIQSVASPTKREQHQHQNRTSC